jgi:RNA 3'-terminal phosphate cyclase (ATP)
LGLEATASLLAWGWHPTGNGEIKVEIPGRARLTGESGNLWSERGALQKIKGVAVAASLPAHIAQRIRNRAVNLLTQNDLPVSIEPQRVRSESPGAGIFLVAEYEHGRAGFSALGKKGKPSEQVAAEAVNQFLAFHQSEAALDPHLADQMILPVALSGWSGILSAERVSKHTLTNIGVVEQFLGPVARVEQNNIRFLSRNE